MIKSRNIPPVSNQTCIKFSKVFGDIVMQKRMKRNGVSHTSPATRVHSQISGDKNVFSKFIERMRVDQPVPKI